MKILHTVESYSPSVGGMQEVVRQLSERLVRLGHSVTVATSDHPDRCHDVINGVTVKQFRISGNAVRGYGGDIHDYQAFLLAGGFDVMTTFAAQQWATDLALPLLPRIQAKKVFVPTGFSALYDPAYKTYFDQMPAWLRQYDMNVFLSDDYRDSNFAKQHGIANSMLIPNGASEDEFLPTSTLNIRRFLDIPDDYFLIIHVGSHTGVKGHAEAMQLFARARIPKSALVIIGNSLHGGCTNRCRGSELLFRMHPVQRQLQKHLLVRDLTRAETIAAYQQADLFLFPSNIECSPIVLFECAASRTPFLTTDVGNAREIVSWTRGGSVMPTTIFDNGMARAKVLPSAMTLENLWRNVDERQRMAEHSFDAFQDRFSWEKITMQYETVYKTIVGSR